MQRFCKPKVGSSILSTGTNTTKAPPADFGGGARSHATHVRTRHALALVLCVGFSTLANAQTRGGYAGLAVGEFSYDEVDRTAALSYGVFGGYRFSDNFAVEGSWEKTADLAYALGERFQGIFGGDTEARAEYQILTVRALGIAQLGRFGVFGGLGYHDTDADGTVRTTDGPVVELDRSDHGVTAVAGVQLDLRRVSYRLQYEWFDVPNRADRSNFALGWLVRF